MYAYMHAYIHTYSKWTKVLLPPRFPITTHVKLLFVECLLGYLSYNKYFYMVEFSDDLAYSNIRLGAQD